MDQIRTCVVDFTSMVDSKLHYISRNKYYREKESSIYGVGERKCVVLMDGKTLLQSM